MGSSSPGRREKRPFGHRSPLSLTLSVSGCSPLRLSPCGAVWGGFTPEEYAGEQSEPAQINLTNRERSAAKSQPNYAKRMECVELTPAFDRAAPLESASKLVALHTLRVAAHP